MNLKAIAENVIEYGAPLLGSLLGGPGGKVIGEIIASEFGVKNTPEEISEALKNTPDAAIKLKQIESNQKLDLQKLLIISEQNQLRFFSKQMDILERNTENARNLKIQTNSKFPEIISCVVAVGFFLCIYWVTAYNQEPSDREVLFTMLGVIGASFSAVVNYWLGSSFQPNMKDKTIR